MTPVQTLKPCREALRAPAEAEPVHAPGCAWDRTRLMLQRKCTCGALSDPTPTDDEVRVRDIAARLWKAEAEDTGAPASVAAGRTPEAFAEQSDERRGRWEKFARAALENSQEDVMEPPIARVAWERPDAPGFRWTTTGAIQMAMCRMSSKDKNDVLASMLDAMFHHRPIDLALVELLTKHGFRLVKVEPEPRELANHALEILVNRYARKREDGLPLDISEQPPEIAEAMRALARYKVREAGL